MNNDITPPPELVQQWVAEIWHEGTPVRVAASDLHIATQAARWGADQQLQLDAEQINQAWQKGADDELAACVFYVGTHVSGSRARALREIRRPKPPSLKELAIEALGPEPLPENSPAGDAYLNRGAIERHRTIRIALEQLDD